MALSLLVIPVIIFAVAFFFYLAIRSNNEILEGIFTLFAILLIVIGLNTAHLLATNTNIKLLINTAYIIGIWILAALTLYYIVFFVTIAINDRKKEDEEDED